MIARASANNSRTFQLRRILRRAAPCFADQPSPAETASKRLMILSKRAVTRNLRRPSRGKAKYVG